MLPRKLITMLHCKSNEKVPLRRAHFVGTSVVVTIDPMHVKRLNIDDLTFFVQKPTENGIILELHKLDANSTIG